MVIWFNDEIALSNTIRQIQSGSKAVAEKVAAILCDRIVKRELAPGDHILDRRFSAALDVSRTPAHETFKSLKADGLIGKKVGRDAVV